MKKRVRLSAAAALAVFITGVSLEVRASALHDEKDMGNHTRERECTCRFVPRSSRYH